MNEIIPPDSLSSLDASGSANAPRRDQSEILLRIFETIGDIRVLMIKLENKIDRLDNRVAALDHRVDRIEQRIDRLDHRMDGLEANIRVIRGKADRVYWTAAVSVAVIGLTAPLLWQGLKVWINLAN